MLVFRVIDIKWSLGAIFDCLVCGVTMFSVSCQMLPHLTHPEEKMQKAQALRSGESLCETDKAVIDCELWLFKQRDVNPTINLMADGPLRCTPTLRRTTVGGTAAWGRGMNSLLCKLGPTLTCPVQHKRVDFQTRRLCTETLFVRAGRLLSSSAGFALLKLTFQAHHLQPHLHYSSSRSSRTRQTCPSADVQRETHRLLAAISLFYDFLSILATGRSSCGRGAWRCIICADLCYLPKGLVVHSSECQISPRWHRQLLGKRRLQPSTSFTLQVFSIDFLCGVSPPVISLVSTETKKSSQMNVWITHLAENHSHPYK